jgi:hypothetical protein
VVLHPGEIYREVTYPLAKAVTLVASQEREAAAAQRSPRRLHVVFPVLVVSSPLYAVNLATDGALNVREVNHLTVERVIDSKTVRGKFRIDVVRAEALESWRKEFIPSVIEGLIDRLGVEVDEGLVQRLVRFDVPTMDDQIEAFETTNGPLYPPLERYSGDADVHRDR